MTEICYSLRLKDLKFFNDHQFCKKDAVKKSFRLHQATIPGFLALIALFTWFYYQDTLTAMWIGVSAVAWGFLAPWVIRWNATRRAMALYSLQDLERILGRYTLRIEPNELVELSDAGESRIAWKDVLRIEPAKNYAFLFVSLDSAIIIPRKSVTEGKILDFFKAAEDHIDKAS